ncbi:hypothetical protein ACCT09_54075, partial [Rhizobium ruizarguesonis]
YSRLAGRKLAGLIAISHFGNSMPICPGVFLLTWDPALHSGPTKRIIGHGWKVSASMLSAGALDHRGRAPRTSLDLH